MSDGFSIFLWIMTFSFAAAGFRNIRTGGLFYLIAAVMCLPLIPFGNRPGTKGNGILRAVRIAAAVVCVCLAGMYGKALSGS